MKYSDDCIARRFTPDTTQSLRTRDNLPPLIHESKISDVLKDDGPHFGFVMRLRNHSNHLN